MIQSGMNKPILPLGLVLLVLLFLLPNCKPIFTSPDTLDPVVFTEWVIAQTNLESYVGQRATYIEPTQFKWQKMHGMFMCGDVRTNGCYHTRTKLIQWNISTPQVIRHEAGHAILHALNHKCASDYEHTSECPTWLVD